MDSRREFVEIDFTAEFSLQEWGSVARNGRAYVVADKWIIHVTDTLLEISRKGCCYYRTRIRRHGDKHLLEGAEALVPPDAGPDDLWYESDFLNLIIRDGALGHKIEFPQHPHPPDSVPHNPFRLSFITRFRRTVFRRSE